MDYDREVSTIAMVSWHPTLFVQMNVQCSLASWHPHEESIQQVGCCFCSNSCSKITCQHIWPVKAMFLRERRARHVRLLTRWCIPSWVRRMTQTRKLWMSYALNVNLRYWSRSTIGWGYQEAIAPSTFKLITSASYHNFPLHDLTICVVINYQQHLGSNTMSLFHLSLEVYVD